MIMRLIALSATRVWDAIDSFRLRRSGQWCPRGRKVRIRRAAEAGFPAVGRRATAASVAETSQGIDVGEKITGKKIKGRARHLITDAPGLLLAVGWLMQHRRLARDYEALPQRSRAMIQWTMAGERSGEVSGESFSTWRMERIYHLHRREN
ncbi:hypothetical protein [Streptomyces parvus]|uniref:hypothetical protein n=1 Tax=Streptomyces parvus TaxID=66428 RepID=UPI00380B2810